MQSNNGGKAIAGIVVCSVIRSHVVRGCKFDVMIDRIALLDEVPTECVLG